MPRRLQGIAVNGGVMNTDPGAADPTLRIIYRSHGAENAKSRPPYYSKLLALASVVRAVRQSGFSPQVVYWNDGPIPGDRLELMRSSGEVVQIDGGSNRASYRAAVETAATNALEPQDVIWFAEDDYLYQPWAFRMVREGALAVPEADYLSVVGGRALDLRSPRSATAGLPRRGAADAPNPIEVGGVSWFRGMSTTSTFGVRLWVLREDRRLLRMIPYSGGAWDHTTCLTVQGRRPFRWDEVREELLPFDTLPVRHWPASMARGLVRSGVNLRSRRFARHRRLLYLSDPVGARHLEVPGASDGVDWPTLAADTRAWAHDQGLRIPDSRPEPGGSSVGGC
jgi:hypothetical protein